MELQTGLPLLMQQYRALIKKNMILSWRNRRSTIAQLVSPLFLTFLLFLLYHAAAPSGGRGVRDPADLVSPAIPPCENKFLIRRPCFDFVWSGNDSTKITTIVSGILENNPGRFISPNKVKSFKTKEEVDEWLFNNPLRTPGALHFEETSETVISYGVQTNSTQYSALGFLEDPTFKFQIPLHVAAERQIARSLLGDSNYSWVVGFKEFAHPAMEMSDDNAEFARYFTLVTLSPVFFLAIVLFGFVFQISSLVIEKELKLRQAMKLMGLYDSSYWLSWLTWEAILALASSLLIIFTGMAFQIPIFLKNNFGIVFLLFFLFQMNMIALAFALSTVLRKSSSASTVGFFIFVVSFIFQIFGTVIKPAKAFESFKNRLFWALFPPNSLSNGLDILIYSALTGTGITWSKLDECPPDGALCMMPMINVFQWLLGIFFFWFILAIYLDNIIPDPSGVSMSIFYFLKPGYWLGSGENKVKEGGIFSLGRAAPIVEFETPDDEDVLEEENAVKHQMVEGFNDPNVAVQIRRLLKKYPGTSGRQWFHYCCFCCICCCSKPKKKPDYHAVKGLCVNIQKNQLFCLLGPNGAGKTTVIGCLTGITPVTSGDALVYGHSIRSTSGLSSIQKFMGVCPQFDVLWEALSGEEHLYLFASIKGLPPASIKAGVKKSLAEVRLQDAAKRRSGSYSGGMKRRLSVAIALIGDPKLVILDEPTTGMDPISRRHVWDIIENAKEGRAIILTTHSMEEADILSDRIGIMAKGRLRCIGTSIRLKTKFGTGLVINVTFSEVAADTVSEEDTIATSRREAMKDFFRNCLDVTPKEETKYLLKYVIPQDKEKLLKNFFTELEERESEFGVADVQLGLTTLEEVFLNVARKAALESAAEEGNTETLTLASGTSILIPVGAKYVGIPGTSSPDNPRGLMVEVEWGQDSEGKLCISGHSEERPIPDNAIGDAVPPTGKLGSNKKGPVHGFVVDI